LVSSTRVSYFVYPSPQRIVLFVFIALVVALPSEVSRLTFKVHFCLAKYYVVSHCFLDINGLLKLYPGGRHHIVPGSFRVHTLLGSFVGKKRDLTSLAPESFISVSHFLSGTGVEFLAQKILTINFLEFLRK